MEKQINSNKHRQVPIGRFDPLSVFAYAQSTQSESFFIQYSQSIGIEINNRVDNKLDTSIIGIGPFESLREAGERTEKRSNNVSEIIDRPFLAVLESHIKELQTSEPVQNRFQNGGIFGCIGYDCVVEIEPILKDSGSFKNRNPEPAAQVLVARELIVFDHKTMMIHLIASSAESLVHLEAILMEAPLLPLEFNPPQDTEINPQRIKPLLGVKEFKKRVSIIKEHIRSGDIFQAVLAERFECATTAGAFEIFRQLRANNPAPYSFYFKFGPLVFLGASPETLVQINGRRVKTHPIAGTRPRGRTTEEDKRFERQLIRSPKEAAEHLMLVDLARNDLGRVSKRGTVNVCAFRDVHRFSTVMHLVSEVEATLESEATALDAFKACFPAGTLSGAPKIRAMQIISELETQPRGYYGGAIVAFDSIGGLESCIAIRSLEIQNQIAVLRAGAGIIADSRSESEYLEILNKTKLLRTAIAAAESAINSHSNLSQGAVS